VDILSSTSLAGGKWTPEGQRPPSGQERILSGSYDGLLRVWNMSSQAFATSPSAKDGGHTSSIKSCKFLSANTIASAGYDRCVRVWKYTEDGTTGNLAPGLELYGHLGSINRLDVHGPSHRILTGSDDHQVGFWSSKKGDAPAAPTGLTLQAAGKTSKRRKLSTSVSTAQRGPIALFPGHTGPVTATIFDPKDHTVGYSTSQDHTLRTWDLTTAALVDTRTTSHPLFSLCALPPHHLIAVGTSARHITLIDPRASTTRTTAMTLRGHANMVVALVRDPTNSYGLLSGSHDGTCRLWDIRASRTDQDGAVGSSTYTISRDTAKGENGLRVAGEGVKVFDVCWDETVGIVSVGEDKRVQINKGTGVTAQA
jgi:ribosome biogenesis protein